MKFLKFLSLRCWQIGRWVRFFLQSLVLRYRILKVQDGLFKVMDLPRPVVFISSVGFFFAVLFFAGLYFVRKESFTDVLLITLFGVVVYGRGYFLLVKRLPLLGLELTGLYVGWYLLAIGWMYFYEPYLVLSLLLIAYGTYFTVRKNKALNDELSENNKAGR